VIIGMAVDDVTNVNFGFKQLVTAVGMHICSDKSFM